MSASILRELPHSASSAETPLLINYPAVPEILNSHQPDNHAVVPDLNPSSDTLASSETRYFVDADPVNVPVGLLWLRRWATNELAKDALAGRIGQVAEVVERVAQHDPESALGISHNLSREIGRLSVVHNIKSNIYGRVDRAIAQQTVSIIAADALLPADSRKLLDSDIELVLQNTQGDYVAGNLLALGVRSQSLSKRYGNAQDSVEPHRMEASIRILKNRLEIAQTPDEVRLLCQSVEDDELIRMKERVALQRMRLAIGSGAFIGALRWSTVVDSSSERQEEFDSLFDEALKGYADQLTRGSRWQEVCDLLEVLPPRTNTGVDALIDISATAHQELEKQKKDKHD